MIQVVEQRDDAWLEPIQLGVGVVREYWTLEAPRSQLLVEVKRQQQVDHILLAWLVEEPQAWVQSLVCRST